MVTAPALFEPGIPTAYEVDVLSGAACIALLDYKTNKTLKIT